MKKRLKEVLPHFDTLRDHDQHVSVGQRIGTFLFGVLSGRELDGYLQRIHQENIDLTVPPDVPIEQPTEHDAE